MKRGVVCGAAIYTFTYVSWKESAGAMHSMGAAIGALPCAWMSHVGTVSAWYGDMQARIGYPGRGKNTSKHTFMKTMLVPQKKNGDTRSANDRSSLTPPGPSRTAGAAEFGSGGPGLSTSSIEHVTLCPSPTHSIACSLVASSLGVDSARHTKRGTRARERHALLPAAGTEEREYFCKRMIRDRDDVMSDDSRRCLSLPGTNQDQPLAFPTRSTPKTSAKFSVQLSMQPTSPCHRDQALGADTKARQLHPVVARETHACAGE